MVARDKAGEGRQGHRIAPTRPKAKAETGFDTDTEGSSICSKPACYSNAGSQAHDRPLPGPPKDLPETKLAWR